MTGQYRCIVADPPWRYGKFNNGKGTTRAFRGEQGPLPLPYPSMTVAEIAALPVRDLAAPDAHLYLWTTSRYLHEAFDVVADWGFRYAQMLVWAKTPGGLGLGGAFAPTTEFIIFARRGRPPAKRRINSTWFNWKRTCQHSRKPDAFLDLVESVTPGPYLELFARRHRLGWDVWGNEIASTIEMPLFSAAD